MEELRNQRVSQVVVGTFHCAALTEDGALFTWEIWNNLDLVASEPVPALGYGSFVHDVGVPYRVFALEGMRIALVAVGTGFTVAVTETEAVYSFGIADGRLGHGEGDVDEDVFLPKRIEALNGIHMASVAAGKYHTLALTRCGRVYSWGAEDCGDNVCGLGNDRDGGGAGDDVDYEDVGYYTPHLITALLGERVRAIAAGPYMSCAVTDAGGLHTWGENASGSLGHGDNRDRNRPTLVQGLQGISVVKVSICATHTLALAADGSVYAFSEGVGLGISGEGGQVVTSAYSPQPIPGLVCLVPQ
jgi:alpha-tubulin suppressor-like RCC1 family protein